MTDLGAWVMQRSLSIKNKQINFEFEIQAIIKKWSKTDSATLGQDRYLFKKHSMQLEKEINQ